ncbi:MAG TPA: ATP-binding protein [Bryobacteraceae bacterium]|nr:ATP-binding protein [Bryobacteraceae bacterium]
MAPSKSDREISEFLLRACHDLRSAARAVRTYSELFLKDAAKAPGAPVDPRLGFIIEGSRTIDRLLEGMVQYSLALQTDPESFQSARMDVLLRFALAQLEREVKAAGAEVTYGELPEVTGNPDRLMQVFENLIRNALVHRGTAAPRIHISAEKQGDHWLLAVHDDGPGVEADFLESIFAPFERLAGPQTPGAGLGLAICRVVMERHGGRIWAESQPGKGATFSFTLPVR